MQNLQLEAAQEHRNTRLKRTSFWASFGGEIMQNQHEKLGIKGGIGGAIGQSAMNETKSEHINVGINTLTLGPRLAALRPNRVKEIRQKIIDPQTGKPVTMQTLANAIGRSISTVERIESGADCWESTKQLIADALGQGKRDLFPY